MHRTLVFVTFAMSTGCLTALVVGEVEATKGEILKRHKVGAQTRFQPIIVGGRIYVTTQDGKLVCFDTGDKKLTGWTQWGANAARTGVVDDLVKN